MGKLRYDPKHHNQQSKALKVMNKTVEKTVKITYIPSPLSVKTCNASEFRSVVQQLTGKDSNNLKDPSLRHQDPPTRVMQGGGDLRATEATEDGKGSYCYNGSMNCLQFDDDYFWDLPVFA